MIRSRAGLVALLLGAVALLGAWSTASSGASSASRGLSPGDHYLTLKVQGVLRDFILHVPPVAVAGRPLVLVFHGSRATAQGTIGVTDFVQEANRKGQLVGFLQGVDDHWNEYSGAFGNGGIDDVAYTMAVIHDIERHVGFDHARIVAAGFSNGALMVQSLGCQLASTLAMVVPVEGQLTTTMAKACKPARPISVYEIHGTADALISYAGGGRLSVLSAPASVAKWASLNHCAPTPRTTRLTGEKVTTYLACRKAMHVALLTIYGGPHRWTPQIGEIVTAAFPWTRPSR